MSESKRSGAGCLIAAIIWIIIGTILAVAARYLILPHFEKEKQAELLGTTSSTREFAHSVRVLSDSFSGYAILRSPALRQELESQDIGLFVRDDQADTRGRMEALRDRKAQMAVFSVDSFLANGAAIGGFPASIVMILDETQGADALVAYETGVASIQDLDSPEARIVLTPNSPSEFLARAVLANFYLPNLPEQWSEGADGSADVFRRFRRADPKAKRAYALWEPHVSMALREPGAHLLLDSSKLKGYIIDVLVAERHFLRDYPDVVRQVVESYLRVAYRIRNESMGLMQLIQADGREMGMEALTDEQAEALAGKIEWKNTLENYAFFGLLSVGERQGALTADEAIGNITDVLVKTKAIANDPLDGQYRQLYYDGVLKAIKDSGFHPAKALNLIPGVDPSPKGMESVRRRAALRPLTDAEWNSLSPVGELRIDPIAFGRGAARINIQSQRDLEALARRLAAWPDYYLIVVGHTRAEGDREANMRLGAERARAAVDFLKSVGVSEHRMQSQVGPPSQTNGSAQSVTFRLGERPY